MRRPLWYRVSATMCGLGLAFALAVPAVLHSCVTHVAYGSGHAHGAPAHAGSHAGSSHEGGSHPADHGSLPPCMCVAACCTAVAPPAPAVPHTLALGVERRVVALAPSESEHRPITPEHTRPPTIGPPPRTV